MDISMFSKAESSSVMKDRLREPLFRNWVASVLMIDVAKVELQKFTKLEMDAFYEELFPKFEPKLEPISMARRAIPNRSKVIDEIHNAHRYGKPRIQTTNFQDSWAVAKCYMPKHYEQIKNVEQTDLSGLLSLVINNLRFSQKIVRTQNPGRKKNVFLDAREVRNSTMHASPMEITGKGLTKNKDILVIMLKSLLNTTANHAIEEIEMLEYGDMSEKDAVYAFKESLYALVMFKQELITNISETNTVLEKMIPNGMETTSTSSIQNTTHNAQEAQVDHRTSETITKTTSDLAELAKHGETAIDNTESSGTTLINTTPYALVK